MVATAERQRLVIDGDPDQVVTYPGYGAVKREGPGGGYLSLDFAESPLLRELGEGLIARIPRHAPLEKFTLLYLWGRNLGQVAGEPRIWRLKKASSLESWALGHTIREPRLVDLFVCVNSEVATRGQMTLWQVQAAVNEALECARVVQGRLQIRPRSLAVQDYIIRRYGPWSPDLKAIGAALAAAEAEQLPLFEDEDDDDDDDDE